MAEIDLSELNSINYETADMLAASGISLPRFKQWSLRGIDYSENPAPGHGKRRVFRLYAAYAYAGIALLSDEAGIYKIKDPRPKGRGSFIFGNVNIAEDKEAISGQGSGRPQPYGAALLSRPDPRRPSRSRGLICEARARP